MNFGSLDARFVDETTILEVAIVGNFFLAIWLLFLVPVQQVLSFISYLF